MIKFMVWGFASFIVVMMSFSAIDCVRSGGTFYRGYVAGHVCVR